MRNANAQNLFFYSFSPIFFGCGSDSQEATSTRVNSNGPHLSISRSLINNGLVAVNQKLSLKFSASLDINSISNDTAYIMDDKSNTILPATVELQGTDTLVFTPYEYLKGSSTYTMVITTGLKDTLGRSLSQNYTNSFTTQSVTTLDPQPFVVRSYKPEVNATNVLTQTDIVIDFNQNLSTQAQDDTNSQYVKVSANGIEVNGKVEVFNSLLKFKPDEDLPYDANITVELVGDVKTLTGLQSAPVISYTFRTELFVEGIVTNLGFKSLYTLSTAKEAYAMAVYNKYIAVARVGGVDIYEVDYSSNFSKLKLLSTQVIDSQILSLDIDANNIIVSTISNGFYVLKYSTANGSITQPIQNFLPEEAIYSVNFQNCKGDSMSQVQAMDWVFMMW